MNKEEQKLIDALISHAGNAGNRANKYYIGNIKHNGFVPKSVELANTDPETEDDGFVTQEPMTLQEQNNAIIENAFGTGSVPTAASGAKREKMYAMPYDLVPYQEITEAYIRAANYGANNHGAWNWTLGFPRVQIMCSLLRHTFAYIRGEDIDKKSSLSHTDHILWNAVALTHSVYHGIEDNRRPEPPRIYK
jgi:Domain of unknown function (DUF5664)